MQRQHHHRHNHLFELYDEAVPIHDLMGGVVDRRQPAQLDREDHDHQYAGKERRDRVAHHGDEGTDLIEDRVLPVGGINADGQGDQNAHHIGHRHHPERLRHALDHDIHHRRTGLPTDHPLFTVRQRGAECVVHPDRGFDDEELVEPFAKADMGWLAQAKRLAHLLLDVRRHGQRHLRHRVPGREFQKQENHQGNIKQRRNGQNQSSDGICQHSGDHFLKTRISMYLFLQWKKQRGRWRWIGGFRAKWSLDMLACLRSRRVVLAALIGEVEI